MRESTKSRDVAGSEHAGLRFEGRLKRLRPESEEWRDWTAPRDSEDAVAQRQQAEVLRGDLTTEEMMNRVLWCLGAGWAVVAVIRLATTPRTPAPQAKDAASTSDVAGEPAEHSPAV